MKIRFLSLLLIFFAQSAIALIGPHYLIGEKNEETLIIAKEVTDARNASEHYFEEFEDKRPYEEQIIRPHQVQKQLKDRVSSGQAILIMDAHHVKPIVGFAKLSGYSVYLIEDGYQRLGLEGIHQQELAFARYGIKMLLVRQKSSPKTQSADRLYLENEEEPDEVTLTAYDNASSDLVGMARVYIDYPKKDEAQLGQIEIAQGKQSLGYGREFFEKTVKIFIDRNMSVSLIDNTQDDIGQKLYGGEKTLKSFDVEVTLDGARQNYKLSKMKNARGEKTYRQVQLLKKSSQGAASPAYDALTNKKANAGSVLELIGYLKAYEKDRQTLSQDAKFLSILDEKLNETALKSKTPPHDGDAHVDPEPYQELHKALLDLTKLLAKKS